MQYRKTTWLKIGDGNETIMKYYLDTYLESCNQKDR